ncbi:ComEC/Rec2 family competence protein [Sinorhizobium alkalisoli]|uniref:Transporter n=1 Tax=Sinorhizobium alkalisoli TaxID=1752398 RepID=A0A1E3VE30_9HYPH|nr:ComEC/Rec2 family competence protein [Sinorhizobium alkalisoli]MCG5477883.1 ComEC/Rec2 family competence protein [Sinorhizobium alkalisoli]ODR91850.1 transporter [Sinorhizobium alkalisoli]
MGEGRARTVMRDAERLAWRLTDRLTFVRDAGLPGNRADPGPPSRRNHSFAADRGRSIAESTSRSLRAAIEREAEFGHGFALIPVLLALGCLAWFTSAESIGIAKLAVLLCVFGMSALLCRGRFRTLRPLALAPLLFLTGMLLAAMETARLDTVILDGPVTTNLRGTVLSREQDDKGRWRYLIEIGETSGPRLRRPPARATLMARSRHEAFPVGSAIEGRARLSPPSGPALPGLNDFAFDAYFNGIGAVGFFYGAPRAFVDDKNGGGANVATSLRTYLAVAREELGSRLRSTIGGDAGAIAAALVTGEKRAISRETVEAMRAAGLSHILAISGLHMVLAAGTFLVGVRTLLSLIPGFAEKRSIKKIAAGGALLMAFLYMLISGGAVSALRSWIMISIMLVAVFFDRVSISLRNVALAALVIIAWTPSATAGAGFQMSFAATLALVAGYARWRDHKLRQREKKGRRASFGAVPGFIVATTATSLIGGLATAIYAASYFHRLPAYGLLANVVAAPLVSILVMPFALFAMLLMPFGLERYPLMVMGQGLDWVIMVARYVAALDSEWVTGRIGAAGFFLIAMGGVLLCVLRTRLAFAGAGLVLLGGAAIALERLAERPSIVISEDGQLVGLLVEGAIATNRGRPPEFIFSQWQRALALDRHVPPTDLSARAASGYDAAPKPKEAVGGGGLNAMASAAEAVTALSAAKPGTFSCRKDEWCIGRSREGWAIVVIDAAELFPALCGRADLVVAATRRPLAACPSGRALVVTGDSLRRSGAIEIHADHGKPGASPQMRVVNSFRSTQRPWERHRRYDWRSGTFFSEQLPP